MTKVDSTKLLARLRFIHPRKNVASSIHRFNRGLQFKQLVRCLFFNFIETVVDANISFLKTVPLLALVVNRDIASAFSMLETDNISAM